MESGIVIMQQSGRLDDAAHRCAVSSRAYASKRGPPPRLWHRNPGILL